MENTFEKIDDLAALHQSGVPPDTTPQELSKHYETQVKLACTTMYEKAKESWACWYDVGCLLYHLHGPWRQPVANLILEALGKECAPDEDISIHHQKWFDDNFLGGKYTKHTRASLVRQTAALLRDMQVEKWGDDLIQDLYSVASTPHTSKDVLQGQGHLVLHRCIS